MGQQLHRSQSRKMEGQKEVLEALRGQHQEINLALSKHSLLKLIDLLLVFLGDELNKTVKLCPLWW